MLYTTLIENFTAASDKDDPIEMWHTIRWAIRQFDYLNEDLKDAVMAYRDEFDTWEMDCDDDNPIPTPQPTELLEKLYSAAGFATHRPVMEDDPGYEYSFEWKMYSAVPHQITVSRRTPTNTLTHVAIIPSSKTHRHWVLSADAKYYRRWPLLPQYSL